MSFTVTDAFVQQFTGTARQLAQQTQARLRGKVLEDQVTGESAYMEQLAPTTARKRTTRHGDSPVANIQHLRRRLALYDYEQGELVDKLDKVRLLIDPTSEYTQALSAAMRRSQDDEIIGAAFSTAYSGHAGATALTWPNGNSESSPTAPAGTVVAVNSWTYGNGTGNAGLTISKLIEAKVGLDAAEGEEDEPRYIAVKAQQIGNLLATTEATSQDYNTVKALVNGTIDTFMGFNFIRTERLQLDSNSYTRVIAWRKSALGLGIGKDIEGQLSQRADKSYAWYPYLCQSIGATRLEESKLVEIKCA
jgi:hypothetical protein